MKRFVYFGFVIIFISMVFMLLIFQTFSAMGLQCAAAGCNDASIFFSMLFGFFVMGAFVAIDSIVGYVIIRQRPWEQRETYKKAATKNKAVDELDALREKCQDIKNAKVETEKQYYKGKFDTETFKSMLNDYDKKLIEARSKIKSIKEKRAKAK